MTWEHNCLFNWNWNQHRAGYNSKPVKETGLKIPVAPLEFQFHPSNLKIVGMSKYSNAREKEYEP